MITLGEFIRNGKAEDETLVDFHLGLNQKENDMLEKIKADGKEELTDADVINIISQYYSVLAPESEGEGAPSDAE